jgi:hypothetical protein
VARAETFAEQFRLGAFAHARRAQQHEALWGFLALRWQFALGTFSFDPSRSISFLAHNLSW